MVESTIMMIPGAWEARRRSGNIADVVEPLSSAPAQLEADRGGKDTSFPGADTERPEPPGWLKVSIFAGTLLTAMWLAMMVFFD
jgi:hypothetical protein